MNIHELLIRELSQAAGITPEAEARVAGALLRGRLRHEKSAWALQAVRGCRMVRRPLWRRVINAVRAQ